MKILLLVISAVVLAGCATTEPPAAQTAQAEKKVVCHREKPTGMAHYVKVCRDVAETSQRDKESKEFMEDRRQAPATDATLGR